MAVEPVGQLAEPVVRLPEATAGPVVERAWDRWGRLPWFPMVVLGTFVVMALFGPWIAPLDPEQPDLVARLSPPAWVDGGSAQHVLGTDRLGRDVLSRIIVGARPSFVV